MPSPASAARAAAPATGEPRPAFTARAVVIGLVLTAAFSAFYPIAYYSWRAGTLIGASVGPSVFPPGVVALAMLLVAANGLLARWGVRNGFSAGELAVIVGMFWLCLSSFQIGTIGATLSVMSAPAYFASPENRWADYFLQYLPSWIMPANRDGAVGAFYNGAPPGFPVPWDVWRTPLFWWGSLLAAVILVVICLMAIVHEQWHDHEKLSFPMAEIPLALIGRDGEGREQSAMRNRLFKVGLWIPLAFILWNIGNWFIPTLPHIAFSQDESVIIVKYLPNFYTKVDFFTIGLSYFAPLPVLLGFWLGRVLIGFEMGLAIRFGFSTGMNPGYMPHSDWGTHTVAWQCFGALVAFVLWGFWVGREHFGKVFRAAVRGDVSLPDRLRRRYRAAVWGLAGGLAYVGLWLNAAGMSWSVIALLIPAFVVLTLGMAKVIVESSLVYADSPVNAQSFVIQTLGSSAISPASLAAIAISYAVFRANAGMMVPQIAMAGRMGDERGVPRGRLYAAIGLAVIVTIVASAGVAISLGYEVGAYNFRSHAFRVGHIEAYEAIARASDFSYGPDGYRLGFFGIGMALMAAVIALRTRFAGFWLHPVGLTFASTSVAGLMAFNIFLAWTAKSVLNRLGGIRLINRAKPLFLGLVCGHSLGVAIGWVIDLIWFRGNGHLILTGWGSGG